MLFRVPIFPSLISKTKSSLWKLFMFTTSAIITTCSFWIQQQAVQRGNLFRCSLQRCHEFLLVEKYSAQRVVVTWNQAIFEKLPLVLKIYANLQDRSGNILAIKQLFLEGKRPKIDFWLIAWGLLLGVSQKAQKTILFITDRLFYHESNINGN